MTKLSSKQIFKLDKYLLVRLKFNIYCRVIISGGSPLKEAYYKYNYSDDEQYVYQSAHGI